MIVFCNDRNEIKDVDINSHNDETLKEYYIDDIDNPFKSFSKAKICCYKAIIEDGKVTMMTPYVDSRLIEHIDQLGNSNEKTRADVDYIAMMTDVDLPEEE